MNLLTKFSIGQYVYGNSSWLRIIDSRLKIIIVMIFLITPIWAGPIWRLSLVGCLLLITFLSLLPSRVWWRSLFFLSCLSLLIGCISIFAYTDIQSLDSYLRDPNELQVVIEKKLETKQPEVSKFTKQGKLRTKAQIIAAERILLNKSIENLKASNKESLDSNTKNSKELQVFVENSKKWNILQIPSQKIWFINFGPYNLSRKAFELGIKTSTLIFTVIHSVNLMLLTTLQEDIVWGLNWFLYPLRKFGLPINKWLFQLLIALRFIPLVQEEFQNIIKSLSVRSINFRNLGFKKSFYVLLTLVERLFKNIFLRIDQGAESLLSKKEIILKTNRFRTFYPTKSHNVIVNTLSICFICIAIFLRKLYGAL